MTRSSGRRRGSPHAILLACVLLACADRGDETTRPSFVVVLADDHRFDALGVVQHEQGERARFRWLATPSLDRLAAEGVRFRNAFVVSALCSPSRASFLTGRYGHANGVVDNQTPLDPAAVSYASLLRAAGYETGYVGKWHMGTQAERPGFDYSASYVGQGSYFDATFVVEGEPRASRGWVDDVTTAFALEFLRRHRTEPFLLVVGYKAPHGPHKRRSVPTRARERHREVELAAPPNAEALPPDAKLAPDAKHPRPGTGRPARVYFDLLSAMDEALGRLLDEIDSLGIRDRTVVVYAADNGYLLGEHGRKAKRWAYESSMRIPLMVRWPALGADARGRTVDSPVLNVDLAPTLLELAGVAPPEGLHGTSLRPLLAGERIPWRRTFLYEYFEGPVSTVPTHFALRDPAAKLILVPGPPEQTQLFDLANDPDETRDLAREPSHAELLREMRARLDREARALGVDLDGSPPGKRPGVGDR